MMRRVDSACAYCLTPLDAGTHAVCKPCRMSVNAKYRERQRQAHRAYLVARTSERRVASQCIQCGAAIEADGKHTSCHDCRTRVAKVRLVRVARWRHMGVCTRCGKARSPGSLMCQAHRERNKVRRKESIAKRLNRRRAAGQCECGREPTLGMVTCAGCRERKKTQTRRFREQQRAALQKTG